MGNRKFGLFLILLCACVVLPAAAGTHPGFESLKGLAGTWSGKAADGSLVEVVYQVVSGGTAVMETIRTHDEDMITLYHPDGSDLMMTHYCMANNQPRMRASGSDASKLSFSFVDATNLSASDAGHMKHLDLTIQDKDHLSQAWTWTEKGKDRTEVFQLQRSK